MADITFTVLATFPEESVVSFATNRGWQAEVSGEPDEEGNPTTIPNPQTAAQFCEIYFKNVLVQQISIDRVNNLLSQLEQTKQEGLAQIDAAIGQAITISAN